MENTERFSRRAAPYDRARPAYPAEVLDVLERHAGLAPGVAAADLGSGTGIFSQLLLERGARVYAVEPNAAMREMAVRRLAAYPGFTSVEATAEQTGLPAGSVGLVTAAQAFHWFDGDAVRGESRRILSPGGRVALLWNDRSIDSDPFARGYEALLRSLPTDYATIYARLVDRAPVDRFFAPQRPQVFEFPSGQDLDFEALRDRLFSTSYAPLPENPCYDRVLAELRGLFDSHQRKGLVRIDYVTRLYLG